MISVITVYDDASLFEAWLRRSLDRQRAPFELIALDNRSGQYSSAARALNDGGRRARGDHLFFAHQDVSFESPDWLGEAEAYLKEIPDAGIAGVAGARPAGDAAQRVILSNIEDSIPPQRADHLPIGEPEPVETVDECAFFVPRRVFARSGFDERTCRGWHLYAVDYALSVRRIGLKVYVLPLPLRHRSGGAIVEFMGLATYEGAYFRTLRRLLRKHRGTGDFIYTTCGVWSTRRSLLAQRFPPRAVARAVRGWIARRVTPSRGGAGGS
jgi:GT2 family glycosyltransferase